MIIAVSRLGFCLGYIEFSDQFRETIRYPLSDDIVVHGAELVADSRLNFGIETARFLYIFHDLFHASPGVKSLYFHENLRISRSFAAG